MERAARYAERAVNLFEQCLGASTSCHDRSKQQAELESALYWLALNSATLCGLQGGTLDKADCAERVRGAARRLRELPAERGTCQGDRTARLAFIAGVFDFNLATRCELSEQPPAWCGEGIPACDSGEVAAPAPAAQPPEGGAGVAARLLRRALARFHEARRAWLATEGASDLDTAAAVTMVAASLARLGEVEEAVDWAAQDCEIRTRLQVRCSSPARPDSAPPDPAGRTPRPGLPANFVPSPAATPETRGGRQGKHHPRVKKAARTLEDLRARACCPARPVSGGEEGPGEMAEVAEAELGWDTDVSDRPEAWVMGALRAVVDAGPPPAPSRGCKPPPSRRREAATRARGRGMAGREGWVAWPADGRPACALCCYTAKLSCAPGESAGDGSARSGHWPSKAATFRLLNRWWQCWTVQCWIESDTCHSATRVSSR